MFHRCVCFVAAGVALCGVVTVVHARVPADRSAWSSTHAGDGGVINAVSLDGIDGRAEGNFDFEPTAFTAEAWVRVSSVSTGSSAGGSIVTYGRGNAQAFSLWLIPPVSGATEVSPRLQINFSNGATRITAPIANPIPFGEWAHVATSYDNQTARVYVNGQLVTEETWDVAINPLPGGVLVLGREFPGVSEWLGGELDEVRIWSRVLTQGEIQQGMMTTACPDAADLFASYPFDGDTGPDVTDASGNGRGLTLLGGAMLVGADAPVVPATNCVPCSLADLSQPLGVLNFFDVSVFVSTMPDLNADGQFDFFDVSLFLNSFNAGCP